MMKNFSNKQAGRLTGIFFILATAAGVASLSFISPLNSEDYLANTTGLTIGALLILFMGMFCAAIAYAIYPVLSRHCKGLALGAAGFRTMEGTLFLLSAVTLLVIVSSAHASNQSAAYTALGIHKAIGGVAGIAFCTGGLLYNIGFYRTKLVPRWLSVWGIIALTSHMINSIMVMFGAESFSTVGMIMNMPIALQEMAMAVYLIIFGFREIEN